ncbi:MAG TPA: hypothetical protein VMV93_08375 [Chloroflexota bacterium]|nr:hypothetical protein [Chloroflexota bacterium]
MRQLKAFYAFWYDFIIGDDWTVAVGVIALFAIIWLVPTSHAVAWLIVPIVVMLLLAFSVWRLANPRSST